MRKSVSLLVVLVFLLSLKCYAGESGLIFGDKDLPPVYEKDYREKKPEPQKPTKEIKKEDQKESEQKVEILPASSPAIDISSVEYVVRAGDTLSGIAQRYNTTVAKIKEVNGLENSLILVGQKLRISGARREIERMPRIRVSAPAIRKKAPTMEEVLSSPEGKKLLALQKRIAIEGKANEITKLQVERLKMQLEMKKIVDEMGNVGKEETSSQEAKTKERSMSGSNYLPTPPGFPHSGVASSQKKEIPKGFATLMISSFDGGKRALVRDEKGQTFYVVEGDKTSKGVVEEITSTGVLIGEKTYPIVY